MERELTSTSATTEVPNTHLSSEKSNTSRQNTEDKENTFVLTEVTNEKTVPENESYVITLESHSTSRENK